MLFQSSPSPQKLIPLQGNVGPKLFKPGTQKRGMNNCLDFLLYIGIGYQYVYIISHFLTFYKPILAHCSISIPPENIRKPKVF